jgi:hypothetical protein
MKSKQTKNQRLRDALNRAKEKKAANLVQRLMLRETALNESMHVPLPQRALQMAKQSIESVPRPYIAVCVRGAAALAFTALMFFALYLFTHLIETQRNGSPFDALLAVLMGVLAGAGVYWAVLDGRGVAPPRICVTAQHYGRHDLLEKYRQPSAYSSHIEWSKVAPVEDGRCYDVTLQINQNLGDVFLKFNLHEGDELVERKIPISRRNFMDGALRSGGYRNTWELRHAMIANLATRPLECLMFDPAVFLHCQLNPVTWARHRGPEYLRVGLMALIGILVGGWIALVSFSGLMMSLWSFAWTLIGALLLLWPALRFMDRILKSVYPMYFSEQAIVFDTGETSAQKRKATVCQK